MLNLILSTNNAGAIYMMRNKPSEALRHLLRALYARL